MDIGLSGVRWCLEREPVGSGSFKEFGAQINAFNSLLKFLQLFQSSFLLWHCRFFSCGEPLLLKPADTVRECTVSATLLKWVLHIIIRSTCMWVSKGYLAKHSTVRDVQYHSPYLSVFQMLLCMHIVCIYISIFL